MKLLGMKLERNKVSVYWDLNVALPLFKCNNTSNGVVLLFYFVCIYTKATTSPDRRTRYRNGKTNELFLYMHRLSEENVCPEFISCTIQPVCSFHFIVFFIINSRIFCGRTRNQNTLCAQVKLFAENAD